MEEKSKDCFVAFIDVLGFTEMVLSKETDNSKINPFKRIVHQEFLPKYKIENNGIGILSISDSIILVAPTNKANANLTTSEEKETFKTKTAEILKKLIEAVQDIQTELAKNNIWVRGAISSWLLWFEPDKNILYGEAFIYAYNLEKAAINPRVIIDPKIILEVADSSAGFIIKLNSNPTRRLIYVKNLSPSTSRIIPEPLILQDAIFICYGTYFISQTLERDWVKLFNDLKTNLYLSQKYYSKYLWLKNYFRDSFMYLHLQGYKSNFNDDISKAYKTQYYQFETI